MCVECETIEKAATKPQLYVPISDRYTATLRLDVLDTPAKLAEEICRLLFQENPGWMFVTPADVKYCLERAS